MILVIIILVLIIFGLICMYNGLIRDKKKAENALSQIDVQLQRRFDLIPNLVETVKGYMAHEEGVLTKIAELRTSWAKASSVSEKVELDNQLSGALKSVFAVSENYPDLKASENFLQLQEELRNTENKVAYARQFYIDSVTNYNTKIELFPNSLIANMFGFQPMETFQITDNEAKENVKVSF